VTAEVEKEEGNRAYGGVNRICQTEDTVQWWAVVRTVMNRRVS
jgi:hypothetical protein